MSETALAQASLFHDSSDRLVVLRNGCAVPERVLRRLGALEDAGLRICVADDGRDLLVSPRGRLTGPDRAFLSEAKPMLMTILAGDVGLVA